MTVHFKGREYCSSFISAIGYNEWMNSAASKLPFKYIDQPQQLQDLVHDLLQQPAVGLDTESNSLFAYQERVCLIQLSTSDQDYLVDTLALSDLGCLASFFASPTIQKIFHAAEYDLICLKRDYGFDILNVFDTMIAARTLGYQQVGLGAVVEGQLGVHLDKRYQRANWGQRPLKPEMLEYARLDSHYLISLRDKFLSQLVEKGHLSIFNEDCERLSRTSQPMANHKVDVWRVKGATDLKPRQVTTLQALLDLRENIARSEDRPPFKIMSDQALLEIAQTQPHYPQELALLPSLSPGQVQRFGKGLLSVVNKSRRAPAIPRNHYSKPDARFLSRKDALSDWRKRVGIDRGVPSDVILPRDMLNLVAQQNPQTLSELKAIMSDSPFRFEQYGEEMLQQLGGKKP